MKKERQTVLYMLILSVLTVTSVAAQSVTAPKRTVYLDLVALDYGEHWFGADYASVSRNGQHPGTGAPSVRRFAIPDDGKITISGRVSKVDLNGGDGVKAIIRLDETEVWSAVIEAKDDKGKDPQLTLDVRRGQALRFVVDARGSIGNDATRWDPLITYVSGPPYVSGRKYQASAAFSDKQGRDGWHYEMEALRGTAPERLSALAGMDLPAMVEVEWRLEDGIKGDQTDWSKPIAHHLDGAQKLLSNLRRNGSNAFLAKEQTRLTQLVEETRNPQQCTEKLYLEVRWLKRRVALANPLVRFDQLLFCKRRPTIYSHQVMQYFGWRAKPGGGLFVLEKPGHSLNVRDILDGKLAGGSVLCPSLSYDGRQIVFSYVALSETNRPNGNLVDVDENYFHLYIVNADGTGLRQITSGAFDDLMPTWLPDGGIAFSSTRRKGYARCFGGQFGQRWHVYTLHRVESDGSKLRILSHHDTNEWFPSVMNDGRIVYARWDYIDRDAVTHQNLWASRPDGSDPVALWGNGVPNPHCAFEARAVPGSSKLVFTASAHHSSTAGSIVLVDPAIDNNSHAALQRLTPSVPFPEAEGRNIAGYYCTPWPLSEEYFLVSYSPFRLVFEPGAQANNALGLYLLDTFGNRELIYRDPEISSTSPMPLRATARPPVIPQAVVANAPPVGTMLMSDVYRGLGSVERGTIKQLRIVQIFPKTTVTVNQPQIGIGGEENARAILGTVPVYEDGSAHFEVPAGKPLLFQALDKDGLAYQTMRTITYLQPGERISCVGCHENRMSSPPLRPALASSFAPSKIEPGALGGTPFSYVRFVQPILDHNCIKCHGGEKPEKGVNLTSAKSGAFTASYVSLTKSPILVPRFVARNQIQVTEPGGKIGALGSTLMRLLRAGHKTVKLTDAELRTLAAWIDLNAVFYGSCDRADNAKELRGEPIAMPEIQ